MHAAANLVEKGSSLREAAKQYEISRNTLKRYIDRKASGAKHLYGYGALREERTIFIEEMETELATHVKKLAKRFHGLTPVKCRKLAYELASQNKISVPQSWTNNKLSRKDWLASFMARHHISIRVPEATSMARATAFNRHTVQGFFNNLATVS